MASNKHPAGVQDGIFEEPTTLEDNPPRQADSAKSQPWKKFWPPMTDNDSPTHNAATKLDESPWLNWKPDPNHPDAKPWIQWLNDKKFNPAFDEKTGRYTYPMRKRGQSTSPKGTVAEGG